MYISMNVISQNHNRLRNPIISIYIVFYGSLCFAYVLLFFRVVEQAKAQTR